MVVFQFVLLISVETVADEDVHDFVQMMQMKQIVIVKANIAVALVV